MSVLVKARRVGSSLVVVLPEELVESRQIREGDVVKITVRNVRKDGFGVLKGMKSFTAKDELAERE